MAIYDSRTHSNNTRFSFYVFDDLRSQEKGTQSNVFYFDTLKEAIDKYKALPSNLTTALGFSENRKPNELDLIQRRNGENVLIRDFLNVSYTRLDPEIHDIAFSLCQELHVEWESDHMLGASILVPITYSYGADDPSGSFDTYFSDKRLDYLVYDSDLGFRIPSPEGPLSSVKEAYVAGKAGQDTVIGYVSRPELMEMALNSKSGYLSPDRPKVTSFYINYIDSQGHYGAADVTPQTLRVMLNREKYLEQSRNENELTWNVKEAALKQIAIDLDQYAYDFDTYAYLDECLFLPDGTPYHDANICELMSMLASGSFDRILSDLKTTASEQPKSGWGLVAQELISKLHAVSPPCSKSRSLEGMVKKANDNPVQTTKVNTDKENPDKGEMPR